MATTVNFHSKARFILLFPFPTVPFWARHKHVRILDGSLMRSKIDVNANARAASGVVQQVARWAFGAPVGIVSWLGKSHQSLQNHLNPSLLPSSSLLYVILHNPLPQDIPA